MKTLITTALFIFSFNSFAGNMDFSTLNCSVESPYASSAEKLFKLTLKFKSVVSAVNNSGLDKTQIVDLIITHSMGEGKTRTIALKDTFLKQYTSTYGYELVFRGKFFGSEYNSYISLSPNFEGVLSKTVRSYKGNIELNATLEDGYDAMIMKTSYLSCVLKL